MTVSQDLARQVAASCAARYLMAAWQDMVEEEYAETHEADQQYLDQLHDVQMNTAAALVANNLEYGMTPNEWYSFVFEDVDLVVMVRYNTDFGRIQSQIAMCPDKSELLP